MNRPAPFNCPTGPNCLLQQLIHLHIGRLPLGTKSTTKHLFHHHPRPQPTPLFRLGLLEPFIEQPEIVTSDESAGFNMLTLWGRPRTESLVIFSGEAGRVALCPTESLNLKVPGNGTYPHSTWMIHERCIVSHVAT